MKKYFLFDDEPISGNTYWQRVLFGSFLMLILVGFWTLAATGYKRAGTFGWKKEYRIIAAILIPILAIGNTLAKNHDYSNTPVNLFDIIALIAVVFHSVLLFKNGNKNSKEIPTQTLNKELNEKFNEFRIKIKNVDSNLDYQLSCSLTKPEEKLLLSQSNTYKIVFRDDSNNFLAIDELPKKAFNENSKFYVKSGVFTYIGSKKISTEIFSRIANCTLESSES